MRLLGVRARQVDERPLVAPLRNQNIHPCGTGTIGRCLLGEEVFEAFVIFKVNRDIDVSRDIRLADVELLEQCGKKLSGGERGLSLY